MLVPVSFRQSSKTAASLPATIGRWPQEPLLEKTRRRRFPSALEIAGGISNESRNSQLIISNQGNGKSTLGNFVLNCAALPKAQIMSQVLSARPMMRPPFTTQSFRRAHTAQHNASMAQEPSPAKITNTTPPGFPGARNNAANPRTPATNTANAALITIGIAISSDMANCQLDRHEVSTGVSGFI